MKTQSLCCYLLLIVALCFGEGQSDCSLQTDQDFGTNSPLLIANGTFLYPVNNDPKTLNFRKNVYYQSYCLGSTLEVQGSNTGTINIPLQCIEGDIFKVPLNPHKFSDLRCSKIADSLLVTRNNGACKNGKTIDIGFKANIFISLIDVCYNSDKGTSNWAHTVVIGAISGGQTVGSTPAFTTGRFYPNIAVAEAYTKTNQRVFLLEVLGNDQTLLDQYIPATGDQYLAPGQLIPGKDLYYTAQQYSTFHYVNALPVWQSVNIGNKLVVDNLVRSLAHNNGDIDVWAGGLYDLKLSSVNGSESTIHLAKNSTLQNSPALVVPKVLFKAAYHRPSNRAIVYLTVNNPFLTSTNPLPNGYQVCKEYTACRQNENRFNNIVQGYTYCCLWDDFIQDGYASALGLPNIGNSAPLV